MENLFNQCLPNENFKCTLKPGMRDNSLGMVANGSSTAELNIVSYSLKAPIKLQTEYDPQSELEKIMLQQIDEIEKREFQDDQGEGTGGDDLTQGDDDKSKLLAPDSDQIVTTSKYKVKSELAKTNPENQFDASKNSKQQTLSISYQLFSSKLAKFKNTKLRIVSFGPAN